MQNIKSIELPEDSVYKMTKIKAIKNPDTLSSVSVSGAILSNPIVLGYPCMITDKTISSAGLITTKVLKIELNKSKILIHTENSVYEIEEVFE